MTLSANQWPVSAGPVVTTPFFDDLGSYLHAAIGFGMSQIPMSGAIMAGLGFMLYQFHETEPLSSKVGDFGELATGLGVGLLVGKVKI